MGLYEIATFNTDGQVDHSRNLLVKNGLPSEAGSGNFSLGTKCITVFFPGGKFKAKNMQRKESKLLKTSSIA